MEKKKNSGYEEEDFLMTASTTDCTGLIPSAITEEEEIENYEELYPFLPKAASGNPGND